MALYLAKIAPLEMKFRRFHRANPHVYAKLKEIAYQVKGLGDRHYGVAAIFERLRWISRMETTDDKYRLNNSFRAFYVRLLASEPGLASMFEMRKSMADKHVVAS